jgi:hypothetical protein
MLLFNKNLLKIRKDGIYIVNKDCILIVFILNKYLIVFYFHIYILCVLS